MKVVELYSSNFRDVAETLRKVADEVDAGEFGAIGCCAIAMLGDQLEVIACGPDAEGPSAATVLWAGGMKLMNRMVHHGE
jgi:hypothetical protein